MYGSARALFRAGKKRNVSDKERKQPGPPIHIASNPGLRRARRKAIGRDRRAVKTTTQFERKKNIFELGAKIRSQEMMLFLASQIFKVERGAVRFRSYRDDAACCRGADVVEQEIRQEKRRQMIDREGLLDPIDCKFAPREHRAGVVDQHIDMRIPAFDGRGQMTYIDLGR